MRRLHFIKTGRHAGGDRRQKRAFFAALLLVSLPTCTPRGLGLEGSSGTQPTFPSVVAYALDKAKVSLPEGLEGQSNLLLLSFAPDQQNQLDTWTAVAQALQHTEVSFRAYRLPVSPRENALYRWWENASLRSAETDPELWHWVVPLYVDLQPFRAGLGIADEKSVVALLVDKGGHILWRATGRSTPETRASLMAAAGMKR